MPPTFPIDYDAIRIALINAVRSACQLSQNNVIMSEPEQADAPRPANPYITLKIITPGITYGDDVADLVSGTIYNYGGPRGMAVSFHSFGNSHEEAYNYMALWQAALNMEATQAALRTAGIAVWRVGTVADLSELLDTGFEGRAHLDCTFGIVSNLRQDLGSIGSVNVTGDIGIGTVVVNAVVSP